MRSKIRSRSLPKKILVWISIFISFFIIISGIWIGLGKPQPPLSLLIVSSPMILALNQGESSQSTFLVIPAEVEIEGLYQVGNYSLESLWKLGLLDNGKKNLLAQSLSEHLGVPITHTLKPGGTNITPQASWEKGLSREISPLNWTKLILQSKNSFSLRDIFWIWNYYRKIDKTQRKIIDLAKTQVLTSRMLPDGTKILKIDSKEFDLLIGRTLEHEEFRKESMSVAVYNTTNITLLGERVSRLLEHIGIHVVTVGNDTPQIKECEVGGTKRALKSKTARFITTLYNCRIRELEFDDSVDLTLRIGTDYSNRYTGY